MATASASPLAPSIFLESILHRKGPEWVAREIARILKGWAESGHVDPETSHEYAFAGRAYWAAAEEIESRGYIQR